MANNVKDKTPPLGAASFWDMAALAMGGRLASCQSCVEFFYFQSKQNAVAFLDSCAAGGLVERISLLELRGDLEAVSFKGPTLRQKWYDQAIYISAPAYRKHNLDASRDRVEGTKKAVYNAFRLYYEELKENDEAIDAAYDEAVKEGQLLRYSKIAKDRKDVDLSHVAKLRLIQDGYKCSVKNKDPKIMPSELENRATKLTVSYILRYWNSEGSSNREVCDRGEELESFINEFLTDHRRIETFWKKYESREVPYKSNTQMLRVINYLVRKRIQILRETDRSSRADAFFHSIRNKLHEAQLRESNDRAYVEALSGVVEDLEIFCSRIRSSIALRGSKPNEIRTEAVNPV